MEKGGQSFFYHADGLGSITEITDSTGALNQQYTYSSFGKIESQLDSNFIQPYTFTGREFDPETGLHHYRHRQYDSSSGRFNSTDPTGFGGRDVNLYPYVKNNPTNLIDPEGLDILFAGFGASAFVSLKPQGTTRGVGKQVTLGIALDTETWTVRLFRSVGVACPTDPRDMVTGINIGIGGVVGQLKGSFEDFFGESREDTLTIGPFSRTKIMTEGGKEGIAVAGGGRGAGLSSTIITTETAPLNLGFLQRLLIQNALKRPAR